MKKIKKTALPLALVASILTLGACSTNNEVYVDSDAGEVTATDVLQQIGSEQLSQAAFNVLLNKIVLKEYNQSINQEQVSEALQKQFSNYGGEETFKELLSKNGLTVEKYKENLQAQQAQTLMLIDAAGIKDEDVKKKYEDVKNQVNASHILIAVKSENAPQGLSDEEAKQRAQEALEKVNGGENFAEVAKKYSNDKASAAAGGELGWFSKADMVKEFADAAFKLKKDEVSGIIKSQFGYHIIKLNDTREQSFDAVKLQLQSQLAQEKTAADQKLVVQKLETLFKKYNVTYKNEALENYVTQVFKGQEKPTATEAVSK